MGLLFYSTLNTNRVFQKIAIQYNLNYKSGCFLKKPEIEGTIQNCTFKCFIKRRILFKYVKFEIKYINKKYDFFSVKNTLLFNVKQSIKLDKKSKQNDNFKIKHNVETKSNLIIASLLNKSLRDYVDEIELCANNFNINNEGIFAEYIYFNFNKYDDFIKVIELLINLIIQINRNGKVKDLLINNLMDDLPPEVQRNNFDIFIENYKHEKDIIEIISKMKQAKSLHTQILVAEFLKEDGILFLIDCLKKLVIINNVFYPYDLVIEVVNIISKMKINIDYSFLIDTYIKCKSDAVLISIIEAMTKLKLNEYTNFIFDHIQSTDPIVRNTCYEYLINFGSKKSVERLVQILKKTLNPLKKSKIQNVISKIKSRLGNVEKGWVSVPEQKDLDGALSKESVDKKGLLSREEV